MRDFILKLFYARKLFYIVLVFSLWVPAQSNASNVIGDLGVGEIAEQTVKSFGAVKKILQAQMKSHPDGQGLFISDYDYTIRIYGGEIRDPDGFEEVTRFVKENEKFLAAMIATRRWHHGNETFGQYIDEAGAMTKEMAGLFPKQIEFDKLRLNLIEEVVALGNELTPYLPEEEKELSAQKLRRGLLVDNILFGGSVKPLGILSLLVNEDFPIKDIAYVVFIDDEEPMIDMILWALRTIKEIQSQVEDTDLEDKPNRKVDWVVLHYPYEYGSD